MPELRFSRLRNEWVAFATERNDRTFLPTDSCPLCPSGPGGDSEVPLDDFEVVVFENRFPALGPDRRPDGRPVRPATTGCEVVVYTPEHQATLADLDPRRARLLVDVWAERYLELGGRQEVAYVYVFENKGEVMGVTLHHPHGQIYALPFVPPVAATELVQAVAHRRATGRCLHCDLVVEERSGQRRVFDHKGMVAFVPEAARWPYELHLYPEGRAGRGTAGGPAHLRPPLRLLHALCHGHPPGAHRWRRLARRPRAHRALPAPPPARPAQVRGRGRARRGHVRQRHPARGDRLPAPRRLPPGVRNPGRHHLISVANVCSKIPLTARSHRPYHLLASPLWEGDLSGPRWGPIFWTGHGGKRGGQSGKLHWVRRRRVPQGGRCPDAEREPGRATHGKRPCHLLAPASHVDLATRAVLACLLVGRPARPPQPRLCGTAQVLRRDSQHSGSPVPRWSPGRADAHVAGADPSSDPGVGA